MAASTSQKYSGSSNFSGEFIAGHPLLQAAAGILMNSNLSAEHAFDAARVQFTMARNELSGGQIVADASAPIIGGRSSGGMTLT